MDLLRFYGAWMLVSQLAHRANGDVYYPRGETAMGQIIYDVTGCVAVQLMRPNHTFTDLTTYQAAMEGCLVYFGTFHVDEQAKIVTHLVQESTYPAFRGEALTRTYEFSHDGTRLTLSAQAQDETRVLVWQRIVPRAASIEI
jgi:hypothetical protein